MAYEIKVPALGESIVEATVARWLKQTGEPVAAGEPVVELETDKVNLEVAADQGGVMGPITKGEGETVAIGDLLGTVEPGDAAAAPPPPAQEAPKAAPATPAPQAEATAADSAGVNGAASATPTAQRIAAEHNLDLSKVTGSGPGGRIIKEDVLRSVAPANPSSAPAATIAPP
ncbi:MAG: dihydrolipoyllysine-residue succinyltransferase, partial [Oscillochloris sp.]|nr:dihydrolipoyllysine-residue succinyltransferase [Oscillochloris sp.]